MDDIGKLVSLCALYIICETSMGQSVNAQHEVNSEYVRALLRINDIIKKRQKNPLMWNGMLHQIVFGYGFLKFCTVITLSSNKLQKS